MENNFPKAEDKTVEELIQGGDLSLLNRAVDHMEGTLPEDDEIPIISIPPPDGKIFFTVFPYIGHKQDDNEQV